MPSQSTTRLAPATPTSETPVQPPVPDGHYLDKHKKETPTNLEANVGAGREASTRDSKPDLSGEVQELCKKAHKSWAEYGKTHDISDLENALKSYRLALKSPREGNAPRDSILTNIARCLSNRCKNHTGEMNDLTEAISLLREAKELCPLGHPDRDYVLNNLSSCLFNRFKRTGGEEDFDEAIRLDRETLKLFPPGHPEHYGILNNIATNFSTRYSRMRNGADLAEAIGIHREIMRGCQPRGPFYIINMYNLASCLSDQYDLTRDIMDLTEAIDLYRQTLELCPPAHRRHDRALEQMAMCLRTRFVRTGDIADIKKAIRTSELVLGRRPPGHPLRSKVLIQLAQGLSSQLCHAEAQQNPTVVNNIISLVKEATHTSPASIRDRMRGADAWRHLARKHGDLSELKAAREILNLLDLAVAESASLESLSSRLSQQATFRNVRGVASDAAALAMESGDYALAVSLLEQGRSSIFAGLGRYRSAINDIRGASPDLATRFVELSAELDGLVVGSGSMGEGGTSGFQDKATRHGRSYAKWNAIVEEIRRLPGLESFLLPPAFRRLQQAAEHGPVVIININQDHSDAIIVLSFGDPVPVPLPDAHPETIQKLATRLGKRQAECDLGVAIEILRETWRIIVAPVVAQLRSAPIQLPAKSRIWWYPVGVASMVPLHAAGPYKRGEPNLAQIFVSSYTPTLGALIRARKTRVAGPAIQVPVRSLLVVGQADTPGERPLPNVNAEINVIESLSPSASILKSSEATKEAVLQGIQDCKWLHLACHGHHHPTQPFKSHFSMHDGPVSLLDLISRDLPQAELAVLSACHSARVSEVLPDESLHPAAGMLFAGFKSVIGTMWAFDDGLGSPLAEEFYKIMLQGNKDHTDAAVALGDAFRAVMKKDNKAVSFMQYINVVHYGA